jgi:hypothetical protein
MSSAEKLLEGGCGYQAIKFSSRTSSTARDEVSKHNWAIKYWLYASSKGIAYLCCVLRWIEYSCLLRGLLQLWHSILAEAQSDKIRVRQTIVLFHALLYCEVRWVISRRPPPSFTSLTLHPGSRYMQYIRCPQIHLLLLGLKVAAYVIITPFEIAPSVCA